MTDDIREKELRNNVLKATVAYSEYAHTSKDFVLGESSVPVSGKCWDAAEVRNLVDASLDFWLTGGRYNDAFEEALALKIGRKYAHTCNSGSSANLLAMSALCSPLLKDRRLHPGDEVITVAAGFPTTVAPIVQLGLIPVFVDVTPPTYNALIDQIKDAVGPKTRAIFLAHTLGNPFDIENITAVAHKHDLWLIEDSCDALGSQYILDNKKGMCGAFGHIATFSFYPAHHITMGEGGAIVCDDPLLHKIILSLRDWGRDCWCQTGHDDTCKYRYQWRFPKLPLGYDHKYIYSHLGYNLKLTDMQAAVGTAQLSKLDSFTAKRRENFRLLRMALAEIQGDKIILPEPTPNSVPSWFGFLITLAPGLERQDLLEFLNRRHIGTRLLFAGNITKQPCFEDVSYRAPFPLDGTDRIMEHTFWVGVFPGLSEKHISWIAESIAQWLRTQ